MQKEACRAGNREVGAGRNASLHLALGWAARKLDFVFCSRRLFYFSAQQPFSCLLVTVLS